MLHFKYIKYRSTLKEKFLANETIHLRKHLRFITNKGFYHDFSGRATFENPLSHPTLNVLFWRIVDSGYPIIPHLFPTIHYHHPRDGRCHPKLEIERSTCAELIRSLIQSDREYQLRNARRMPWKKRGSFEILCELISLLISPPPPPCYHDPFPVSRLIFVTGEIFFPIFTLLSFHPSRELRERMTRMKHFFFEITWGRKDG